MLLRRSIGSIMKRSHHHLWDSPGNPRVAVILAGSGVYDGSEVHEASSVIMALSRQNAEISLFAPDKPQMHVIDHTKGAPSESEARNVLVESARIGRGKVTALAELKPEEHDAIIIPGGFGSAKNLCTFAVDQDKMTVDDDVSRVLKSFHAAEKPIGLCCIAPVIAAKLFPGCSITMGAESEQNGKWPHSGATGAIAALGGKHVVKDVNEIEVDESNRIVTTPAFMCETQWHHIADGISNLVSKVLVMTKK